MSANITDSELWEACAEVLKTEGQALEVWRISSVTGMPEGAIISALIRETGVRKLASVQFRYPPLPCAAITAIFQP